MGNKQTITLSFYYGTKCRFYACIIDRFYNTSIAVELLSTGCKEMVCVTDVNALVAK